MLIACILIGSGLIGLGVALLFLGQHFQDVNLQAAGVGCIACGAGLLFGSALIKYFKKAATEPISVVLTETADTKTEVKTEATKSVSKLSRPQFDLSLPSFGKKKPVVQVTEIKCGVCGSVVTEPKSHVCPIE